jgi:hypothetical protein
MLSIFLTYTVGASKYGSPHDSSAGIPAIYFFVALLILGFIVLKVYLEIRKDKNY